MASCLFPHHIGPICVHQSYRRCFEKILYKLQKDSALLLRNLYIFDNQNLCIVALFTIFYSGFVQFYLPLSYVKSMQRLLCLSNDFIRWQHKRLRSS